MPKYPRVRDVVRAAKGGIEGVKTYFDNKEMLIDPSTWCGQIKKSIDENHVVSVMAEIELIKEKFNFYKDVSKEEGSNPRANSVDGKGHTETKG